jgi:hypothetical protein
MFTRVDELLRSIFPADILPDSVDSRVDMVQAYMTEACTTVSDEDDGKPLSVILAICARSEIFTTVSEVSLVANLLVMLPADRFQSLADDDYSLKKLLQTQKSLSSLAATSDELNEQEELAAVHAAVYRAARDDILHSTYSLLHDDIRRSVDQMISQVAFYEAGLTQSTSTVQGDTDTRLEIEFKRLSLEQLAAELDEFVYRQKFKASIQISQKRYSFKRFIEAMVTWTFLDDNVCYLSFFVKYLTERTPRKQRSTSRRPAEANVYNEGEVDEIVEHIRLMVSNALDDEMIYFHLRICPA